jgi:hypothetical protein
MRWRRRARVVFPLEEGPERAIMDVFVMIFCDLFLSISMSLLLEDLRLVFYSVELRWLLSFEVGYHVMYDVSGFTG